MTLLLLLQKMVEVCQTSVQPEELWKRRRNSWRTSVLALRTPCMLPQEHTHVVDASMSASFIWGWSNREVLIHNEVGIVFHDRASGTWVHVYESGV